VPAAKDLKEGRDVQLAVYDRALAALFDEPALGGAYHKVPDGPVRFFAAVKQYRGAYREDAKLDEKRAHAAETIGRIVSAVRDGRFDALPTGKCSARCPYRPICHHAPARAERKTADAEPEGEA